MAALTKQQKLQLPKMRRLEQLSPFELKDRLIELAAEHARAGIRQMLNAGRGNPNWIATTPREAFFTLGRFGIEESRRVWSEPDTGGMSAKKGIARRFRAFLDRNAEDPGAVLLRESLEHGVRRRGFDATIDLLDWMKHEYGAEVARFARDHHPFEMLFALAERHGTVLLGGSGFAGPDWSVRVSLANLDQAAYEKIGDQLRALLDGVVEQWRAAKAKPSCPGN